MMFKLSMIVSKKQQQIQQDPSVWCVRVRKNDCITSSSVPRTHCQYMNIKTTGWVQGSVVANYVLNESSSLISSRYSKASFSSRHSGVFEKAEVSRSFSPI